MVFTVIVVFVEILIIATSDMGYKLFTWHMDIYPFLCICVYRDPVTPHNHIRLFTTLMQKWIPNILELRL